MTDRLNKTLTVGLDHAIFAYVHILAVSVMDRNVNRVMRNAIEYYLDQPARTPVERVSLQLESATTIAKFRERSDGSWHASERWSSTREPQRSDKVRVSVSLDDALRERLEKRSALEHCAYAELVRTAVEAYLADLIAGNAFDRVDPALLQRLRDQEHEPSLA